MGGDHPANRALQRDLLCVCLLLVGLFALLYGCDQQPQQRVAVRIVDYVPADVIGVVLLAEDGTEYADVQFGDELYTDDGVLRRLAAITLYFSGLTQSMSFKVLDYDGERLDVEMFVSAPETGGNYRIAAYNTNGVGPPSSPFFMEGSW
jgi:hypothetical protein